MSLIQRRLTKAGLSKQVSQGTAATAATYGYGIASGSVFKLDLTEDEIPLTWSNRDVLGFDRSGVKPSQDTETVATPNLLGLLLLGVLGADAVTNVTASITSTAVSGSATSVTLSAAPTNPLEVGQTVVISGVTGSGATPVNGTWQIATVTSTTVFTVAVTTTGAGTGGSALLNYSHAITPNPTVPYMTAWGSFGTADWFNIVDSKVSALELSWEAAGKVTAKPTIMGITPQFLASSYTETNNEVLSSAGYFTAGGGVFSVEGVSAAVTGGTLKFDTHIEQPITAATVLPADVVEGKLEVTWSLKILPTDTSLFRKVYFGVGTAGALTGITPFPRLGAVSCQFNGPNGALLTVASPKVRFMVEFPESSPDGGPAELTLAGTSTLPSSGSSVTATLLNAVASY